MTANRKAILITIFAAPLAIVLAILAIGSGGPDADAPSPANATAHTQAEGGVRTVLVSRDRMPAPSPAGETLHALRVSGPLPTGEALGTVLTDEDCAPDGRGVSHCLNEIELPGERLLRVRHPHRMTEVPCLSPGERVSVRAA